MLSFGPNQIKFNTKIDSWPFRNVGNTLHLVVNSDSSSDTQSKDDECNGAVEVKLYKIIINETINDWIMNKII